MTRAGAAAMLTLALLALGACAPAGPPFATVAATLPPVPPGEARVYFYRWLEPYETTAESTVILNGVPAGISQTGAAFYRDVAPGRYTISLTSRGVYPNQFKTVELAAGQTAYARIESFRAWCNDSGGGLNGGSSAGCYDTFVVELIDPAVALGEMRDLSFIRG